MMRDVRYAIRVLLKAPVFAVTAIVTLGLCIGANTAIYTVVDRLLLRPLPYPDADRLAAVSRHVEGQGGQGGQGGSSDIQRRVSAGFFHVLGVTLARGREFTVEEDQVGGSQAVILSQALIIARSIS